MAITDPMLEFSCNIVIYVSLTLVAKFSLVFINKMLWDNYLIICQKSANQNRLPM